MKKLEVRLGSAGAERAVGTLAEDNGRLFFEYAPSFVSSPLPLSPITLGVKAGIREHVNREFGPVFGLFNDSLPDGWGLLLMDRDLRGRGIGAAKLSVVDKLAYIGTRGMGALTYHPSSEPGQDRRLLVDLEEIAAQAERLVEGSEEDVLPSLVLAGGSPMGARPKILVGVSDGGYMTSGVAMLPRGYRHYLIKFLAKDDPKDLGAVELAYANMARGAGLLVPDSRLFHSADGHRYFGVERFDRKHNQRLHMLTLSGLLEANYSRSAIGYDTFLRATQELTQNMEQVMEGFRRMVFNVLSHNRDDHSKNFAYIMSHDGKWELSPAYDIVFSEGPLGEHTMDVGGAGRDPGIHDMMKVAQQVGLDKSRCRQIVEQVQESVSDWERYAAEADVSRGATQSIAARLQKLLSI